MVLQQMARVLNVDAYKLMEAFSNEHLRTQEEKSNKRQRTEEHVVQLQCTEQGCEDTTPIG